MLTSVHLSCTLFYKPELLPTTYSCIINFNIEENLYSVLSIPKMSLLLTIVIISRAHSIKKEII